MSVCGSKGNEETKQQGSELAEQLRLRVSENSAMNYELHDLRKRLEMADLMIQQVKGPSWVWPRAPGLRAPGLRASGPQASGGLRAPRPPGPRPPGPRPPGPRPPGPRPLHPHKCVIQKQSGVTLDQIPISSRG